MVVSRGTYIRRRITVFGAVGIVFSVLLYLPMSLLAPLEPIAPVLISVSAPENPIVELDWPGNGSAAIGAVGYRGVLAHGSDTSPRPIASITKVITALVVLDEKPLAPGESGPVITMTQHDVTRYQWQIAHNGSAKPVAPGVKFTQRELLDIVLIASANNYAETMARWAFGSEESFLVAARAWLDAHGLGGIHLVDSTGLDPRNTATPADLIELGKLALANPL
ncbi:MAG: D-alanyl-D-alanine carboxypeptidase, partial [Terrimesophilobacter sp.]